jgi:hypothetical protein
MDGKCSPVHWTGNNLGSKAESKLKDKVLAWQPAHENLAWSHQHSETGSRIHFKAQILLLQPEYCPLRGYCPGLLTG